MSGTGNTIGRLVGQTSMADVPAADANPPIIAETPEEAEWLAKLHTGLDVLGAIPAIGAVFDGANALIYVVEGNTTQAAISGGATVLDLVPGVGTAGKVAELGIKGAAKLAAKDAAEQAAKHEAEHLAKHEAKKIAEQEAKQVEKTAETVKPGKDGAKIHGQSEEPPKLKSENVKDKKRKVLKGNKTKGKQREQEVERELREEGHEVLGTQVSAKTPRTRRVIDILIKDGDTGQIRAIEVKSGTAVRSSTQLAKDDAMKSVGGEINWQERSR